jgi:DNA polymerase V
MSTKEITIYSIKQTKQLKLPIFTSNISAGFPSPADDFVDQKLDLNQYLVPHPQSTFFVKVQGESMIDAGICSGDMLVVDRSLQPKSGNVIIAVVDGEFTVKRFVRKGKHIQLIPENKDFEPIEITDQLEFSIWGVVTNVIHKIQQ